ncbi:DUF4054 domain-containing protein [Acetobacter indonesiensis]|uniref:DUF4054 domain-containing protein n=1 Tax=Acetobacter indonesiensis TaxID=104101 RepID=UPI0015C505ED|nr:DUF4054 domain-containing protein [Acetobacter indonesiensis]
MSQTNAVVVDADHVVTTTDFRTFFPEFSDATKYLDVQIAAYLRVGTRFVSESRWADSWSFGVCLFAAHELTMGVIAANAAASGGTPGASTGILASKSVGPLSKSYDTSFAKYDDAGYWNLTTYGQRYWYFMRLFGAGGTQL